MCKHNRMNSVKNVYNFDSDQARPGSLWQVKREFMLHNTKGDLFLLGSGDILMFLGIKQDITYDFCSIEFACKIKMFHRIVPSGSKIIFEALTQL